YAQITMVNKTVRAQRDFGRMLRNFVNFSDFYSKQDGVFQTGTLYLDARAFHLCVPVTDTARHGALAGASDACLIYCDISRKGEKAAVAATAATAAAAPPAEAAKPAAPAAPAAPEPAKPSKIDLGTIAAIGVAIGGIGTLVGALLANLFGLGKWLPVGLLALL